MKRICIELPDEDYRELLDMLVMHPELGSVEALVRDMVTHNISNYRRLKEWVRKIIEEVMGGSNG